jgi:hypothetical protein
LKMLIISGLPCVEPRGLMSCDRGGFDEERRQRPALRRQGAEPISDRSAADQKPIR